MAVFQYSISTATFDRRFAALKTTLESDLPIFLKEAFERRVKAEYVRIVETEFPVDRELDSLMRGEIIRRGRELFCVRFKAGGARQRVGSTEDGRLLKGSFHPISQVLAQDPARVAPSAGPGIYRVGAAPASVINSQTSFEWDMVVNGKQYSSGITFPFGHSYLQALEDGGSVPRPNFGKILSSTRLTPTRVLYRRGNQWVWRVEHRRGRRLWPEPNVFVWEVRKTLRPLGMFRRSLYTQSPAVLVDAAKHISRLCRGPIGFGSQP